MARSRADAPALAPQSVAEYVPGEALHEFELPDQPPALLNDGEEGEAAVWPE